MNNKLNKIYDSLEKIKYSRKEIQTFTLLQYDEYYIKKNNEQEFIVVAEDKWDDRSGMCIVIDINGKVYTAEIPSYKIYHYCANSFKQFIDIAELYWSVMDRNFEISEESIREKINKIDVTALKNDNNFWSVLTEEIGYEM